MRYRLILLGVLSVAGLACSTTTPGELDSDSRDQLAALSATLERLPPDLTALDEAVEIYATNGKYRDAQAAIDGVLKRSHLDPAALARVAAISAKLARQAEHQHSETPRDVPESQVVELTRRAQALSALARYRAERSHGEVSVELSLRTGDARRLTDVMVECSSRELASDSDLEGSFTLSYFGDRLRLDAPSGTSFEPREALLAEVDRLTIEADPSGRPHVRIEPQSWARETRACVSCSFTDACALIGDGSGSGGIERVDLDTVSEASFHVRTR
jgi:hypothetical protein